MSNVRLAVAGREYLVACSPGEEAHLALLGEMIDSRLSSMPNIAGQPEVRRFLYAALLLADELHELQERPASASASASASPSADTAETLEALADRLERLAGEMEADRDASLPDQPSPQ